MTNAVRRGCAAPYGLVHPAVETLIDFRIISNRDECERCSTVTWLFVQAKKH